MHKEAVKKNMTASSRPVYFIPLFVEAACPLRADVFFYISGIEFHVDFPKFFFTVNVVLIHFCQSGHASVTVCFDVAKRLCHNFLAFFSRCFCN